MQDKKVVSITEGRRTFRPDPNVPAYDPSNPSHREIFEIAWKLVDGAAKRRGFFGGSD